MKTNAYVYKITNKITNEFYIGYRYKNQVLNIDPENDLWINYFTSSTKIKSEIQKHGTDSFYTEILFTDIDSLLCWKQEQILIKDNWDNPLLLNGKYHDPESNVEIFRRTMLLSDESRLKMSVAGKGRPKSAEHRKKIAIANTGKPQSVEKCRKISEARKGKPTNKGVSPPKYQCPNCSKMISRSNYTRWHGDMCKTLNPEQHEKNIQQIKNLANIRNKND